ncbi:MAG: hypothetical protein LBB45_03355 [Methanobrevibacter sp.]|jgi:hypothetical protein|nr:hypothetical protein [Candidatus Methanovirga basalitermitum]
MIDHIDSFLRSDIYILASDGEIRDSSYLLDYELAEILESLFPDDSAVLRRDESIAAAVTEDAL